VLPPADALREGIPFLEVRTEALPGTWHEERRLSHVEYRDGWTVHSGSGSA